MLADVERGVSQQSGGDQSKLSQLELARHGCRYSQLDTEGGAFSACEREKGVAHGRSNHGDHQPAEAPSNMTDDDFRKACSPASDHGKFAKEARRTLPSRISGQNTGSKIAVNDKEVEDFYNSNKERL